MCSISDIPCLGACLNRISEDTVGAVFRGIGYILDYKVNVDKLNSEVDGLHIKELDMERRVEEAKNNGKSIILEHVSKWQADVKKIKGEVTEFKAKYEGRTSWRCFNVLWCPNPYHRFRFGRGAAKKTTTVSEFSDLEKKQLIGEIAQFPPDEYSPISSNEYQNFGSREVAYKKILEALNSKEDGFPVVGVYGFGGVGKTRMMEEASNEVKAKRIFQKVVRANVGQEVDIGKIQNQLLTSLAVTQKIENRTSQLKAIFSNGNTFLVILDDVWKEISFTEIGIPFRDSKIKGCKILLTSRLRDVCIKNNCNVPVKIEALNKDEAWDMFTETVGTSTIESVDEYLARQVCNKCACLPLIIAAVGKALREKSQEFWKDARNQLINCNPENIQGIPPDAYACLRLSFNILHKDAYLCLLLCSLAGEDEEIKIEFLIGLVTGSGLLKGWNTLEEARNRVTAMVSELKSSSLLLEGQYYDGVKLHDIIRDVARSITAKDPEYAFLSESNCPSLLQKVDDLTSRKLIYLDFQSENVYFPDDRVCPDLHTLYLKCSNISAVQLPNNFFESFPKLKYLLVKIKSLSAMPSSIQNLDILQSLTIHRCKVNDISHIIQLKNLKMLSLRKSCFGGLLLDLRQLRHLRMLDLLGCTEIMGIVLSDLTCLEELYLPKDCNILDEETKRKTPLSSVRSKLTSLEIYFEDVKSCPDENFCGNLCRYKIFVGFGNNMTFPKYDSAMKSVYFCNDSIGGGVKTLVEKGDYVRLERVTGLQKCFSQGGGAFTDLKWLKIRECMGDEYLSRIHPQPHQRAGFFSKLSVLQISKSGFKYLFCTSTARCLQQLEELKIHDCKMMEEIARNEDQINEIIYFPKLRYLGLTSLPVFKSFCGKVVFPALERLIIKHLDNITEIWEEHGHLDQESFCRLNTLSVGGCHKLKNVIPYAMRQRLQNLITLHVEECDLLISEVEGPNGAEIAEPLLVVFPKLKQLRLSRLPKLMETGLNSSDIILYPNLTTLFIKECNNMRNVFLPSVAGHYLELLERLEITSCETMEEIVRNEGQINEIIYFPKLKALYLISLPVFKSFCGKVSFPSLEKFRFSDMKINLEEIDLGRDSTSKLRTVNIEGSESQAGQLIIIPPNWLLPSRDCLEWLNVMKCEFHEGDLFRLLGNSWWKNNPYGTGTTTISFPRLSVVVVDSCRLSTIFTCSVAKALPELERLEVRSCGSIEEIVTDEGRNDESVVEEISFPILKYVELEDLPNLKSFCRSANYCFKMPSLTNVTIRGCPQVCVWPTDINNYLHLQPISNTQELLVDKKEELKPNHVDKGKSIVTG